MTNKQLIEVLGKANSDGRVHLVVCLKDGKVAGGVLSHTEKNNGNTLLVANDIICDDGKRFGKGKKKYEYSSNRKSPE